MTAEPRLHHQLELLGLESARQMAELARRGPRPPVTAILSIRLMNSVPTFPQPTTCHFNILACAKPVSPIAGPNLTRPSGSERAGGSNSTSVRALLLIAPLTARTTWGSHTAPKPA
jgi:hypothetical protein